MRSCFALEQVDRDRAGIVRVEQLLALRGELGAFLDQIALLGCGRGLQSVEAGQDALLDPAAQLGREGDGAVLVFDELLDQVDRHGLAFAVGGLPLAAGADEILVGVAPAVRGALDQQP